MIEQKDAQSCAVGCCCFIYGDAATRLISKFAFTG
jgi:hypothetical protein